MQNMCQKEQVLKSIFFINFHMPLFREVFWHKKCQNKV